MILKVLTVDDSELITTYLAYVLNDLKEVNWIGHAFYMREAKALIKIWKPDVVFLDIKLKDESGFDLLNYIKKSYPDMIVLMLSNMTNPVYFKKSIQLGAHYLIDKSYDFYTTPNFLLAIHRAKNIGQKLKQFNPITQIAFD